LHATHLTPTADIAHNSRVVEFSVAFIKMLSIVNFSLCLQTTDSLKQYYATCFALVGAIILFGGLIAPVVSNWSFFPCPS